MSAGVVPSSEYLITTTVLTQNETSVTFDVSSFAGVYKHLQIVYAARATPTQTGFFIRLNGDGSSSYRTHYLLGNGSSVSSASFDLGTRGQIGLLAGSGAATNEYRSGVIDLVDPYSASKNTTVRGFSSSQSAVILMSVLWLNTTPVSSIQLTPDNGDFVTGSRLSIYGVTA
jgi:hypothetical protein